MLPRETLPRLAKLLPMLGSDKDGEVVAAAHAIGRALKAAGTDWHGLTAAVTGQRTGWVPTGRPPAARTSGPFSYANAFREAGPVVDGPEHPEGLTRRFGLPVYVSDRIEPWTEVARYCLRLNHTLPSRHGGKFLEKWEKALLRSIEGGRQPTNRHVEWIERTLARLHQARDAAAKAGEP